MKSVDPIPDGDYVRASQKNAEAIESAIRSLDSSHWDWFKRQYKEFWAHARDVSAMFKSLKPLRREDRERLWGEFNSTCEEVKRKQHSDSEDRRFRSDEHRKDILREAENARPCSLFGFLPPDVQEMKHLGGVLRRASNMLSTYKQEMFGEHKQECFARIQEIRAVHDAWWEEMKGHRSRRQEEFQARVRANLEKNYERHRKATDGLERVRRHADDLREQIASAWNDDFRDRASGWLSETEDKIRDIEESIATIEDWIREDEEKLK